MVDHDHSMLTVSSPDKLKSCIESSVNSGNNILAVPSNVAENDPISECCMSKRYKSENRYDSSNTLIDGQQDVLSSKMSEKQYNFIDLDQFVLEVNSVSDTQESARVSLRGVIIKI